MNVNSNYSQSIIAMLKKLIEKRAKLYAQIVEQREKLNGKTASTEEQAAWDKLMTDYRNVEAEIIIEERRLETERLSSQNADQENERRDAREREIFRNILLHGNMALSQLTPEERTTITGTSGTNLMPKSIADKIEIAMLASGGIMEVADVIRTTRGEDLGIPTLNDTSRKATIVSEYSDVSLAALTFSQVVLKAFTYRTPIMPISWELLQDSQFDLEALLVDQLGESFNRALNDHFTNAAYNATTTPRGIVSAANNVAGAATGSISADDLLNLMGGVNAAYWKKAKFMFNQTTLIHIMKLKDEEGRYIWNPDMAGGARASIFGFGYQLNPDMENIAATKNPVIFGDFKKYKVRIVRGVNYMRLNELLAQNGAVGFLGFCRADGALVDAGTHPVSKLTVTAAAQ